MTINAGPCYRCKTDVFLPDELYHAAKRSPSITFYCPYGHAQHFIEGESEETKLRRELQRAQQRLAEKDDRIRQERDAREATERRLSAQRGQVTKLKNRAANGVCPCCSRHFTNLERHMASQHPGFAHKDDAA